MPDWRWVTQVTSPGTPHVGSRPQRCNGQWIDMDGVDSIMPYDAPYHPAQTRLGWMTNSGWHYLFVAEKIVPVGADNNNPQGESNADNAMEPVEAGGRPADGGSGVA